MAFFTSDLRTAPQRGGDFAAAVRRPWTVLGRTSRTDQATSDDRAQANHAPAASEAERARRLRASFEDDLAHFLRNASGTPAE